jgi:diadenylate cyclase
MAFTWRDLLDILLVTALFYSLWRLIVGTRALNLVRGLLVYLLVWFLANLLGLATLSWILGNAATLGAFALIVVFQPELRGLLERLGRPQGPRATSLALEELLLGVARLAERRYGALIALERRTPLGEYAATGEVLEARLSARLLVTLFYPGTPLHDGGAILREGRLLAAGCLFPLSEAQVGLGTRHRAALGLSEVSDALVLVVSEETGSVRLAEGGGSPRPSAWRPCGPGSRRRCMRDWPALLLSFLAALAVWYSLKERAPVVERALSAPLQVVGLEGDRVAEGVPREVLLRLRGPAPLVEGTPPVSAYLDLSGAEGAFSREVRVAAPRGVESWRCARPGWRGGWRPF